VICDEVVLYAGHVMMCTVLNSVVDKMYRAIPANPVNRSKSLFEKNHDCLDIM